MNDITRPASAIEVKADPDSIPDKNTKTISTGGICKDCKKDYLWRSVNKRCRKCELKAQESKPEPGGEVILKTSFSKGNMIEETKKKHRPLTSNLIIDMIRELKKMGAGPVQAAKALRDAGHKTPTGKEWSASNITPIYYNKLKDVKRGKPIPKIDQVRVPAKQIESKLSVEETKAPAEEPKKQRGTRTSEQMIELIKNLKIQGLNTGQAAMRMNQLGHKTANGLEWTIDRMHQIYYVRLKKVKRGKPSPAGEPKPKILEHGDLNSENNSPAPINTEPTHEIQQPNIEQMEADIKNAIMKAMNIPPVKRFRIGDEIPYGYNMKLRVVGVEENVINFQPIVTLDIIKIEGTVET